VIRELDALVNGEGPFDIRDIDEVMEGCVPGLDPRVLRRLRRGEFTPQADLDLHGCDAATARVLVEEFIVESHARGLRCLRIVHGRGNRSPNGEAVLKPSLPRWLARGPARLIVLAWTAAPSRRRRRRATSCCARASRTPPVAPQRRGAARPRGREQASPGAGVRSCERRIDRRRRPSGTPAQPTRRRAASARRRRGRL
jgi:hypothetical protein